MEWYELGRAGGDPPRYEWGVRWDITDALRTNCGSVVTHEYRRYSDDGGDRIMTDRMQLVITLGIGDTDEPWGTKVVHVVREALHPNQMSDPAWVVCVGTDKHDQALAYLEAVAEQQWYRR
jgi:hypothetical protein